MDYSSQTRETVVMHLKLDWRDISSSQVIAKWGSSRRRLSSIVYLHVLGDW